MRAPPTGLTALRDVERELRELPRSARAGRLAVPITCEIPADLLTPVAARLRLARGAAKSASAGRSSHDFLLESVEGGERLARYSFLGREPFETWTIRGEQLEVTDEFGAVTRPAANPFREMGRRLAEFRAVTRPGLPPFAGGAVGYLGYECARFIEDVPMAPPPARGSAERRLGQGAEAPSAQLSLFRNVVAFDHVRQRIVMIANLFPAEESLARGYARAQRELARMRDDLARPSSRETPLSLPELPRRFEKGEAWFPSGTRASLSRAQYGRALKSALGEIRNGEIFQCVLSNQFRFPMPADPFTVYRILRTLSPAPYLYFLGLGQERGHPTTLLGASPEMLVRAQGGELETCPIAGTRPRSSDPAEDLRFERHLLASVKERAEHLMLVDLGRNDLGRVSAPGTVRVQDFMKVERFSHVMHLVSLVRGQLKRGHTAWDALASCFPAGTLTGAPKIRAMEIISDLEPVRRGAYGGAVVYHDFSGQLDACITIRSLFCQGGDGVIQAGGGVVADSTAEGEYQEILNKTRAIRKALAYATLARSSSSAKSSRTAKSSPRASRRAR